MAQLFFDVLLMHFRRWQEENRIQKILYVVESGLRL